MTLVPAYMYYKNTTHIYNTSLNNGISPAYEQILQILTESGRQEPQDPCFGQFQTFKKFTCCAFGLLEPNMFGTKICLAAHGESSLLLIPKETN